MRRPPPKTACSRLASALLRRAADAHRWAATCKPCYTCRQLLWHKRDMPCTRNKVVPMSTLRTLIATHPITATLEGRVFTGLFFGLCVMLFVAIRQQTPAERALVGTWAFITVHCASAFVKIAPLPSLRTNNHRTQAGTINLVQGALWETRNLH